MNSSTKITIEEIEEQKKQMYIHMREKVDKYQSRYEDSVRAVAETEQLLDMILINVCKMFGTHRPEGLIVEIPKLNLDDLKQYDVSCERDELRNIYRITTTYRG